VRVSLASPLLGAIFLAASGGSLGASAVLVRRLEGIAARFGLREAALGLLAAVAADGPEITSSITALIHHDPTVSAGVVFGSNAFNLAALLGVAALVAGRIDLARSVVALDGGVAIVAAAAGALTVAHVIEPLVAGLIVAGVVGPYVVVSVRKQRSGPPSTGSVLSSVEAAIRDEESEIVVAVHPVPARPYDRGIAAGSLGAVIVLSVVMEQSATTLAHRWSVPAAITGGVVLAAVTSIPNAVAAVYFARRGRGTATLATAMNSNTANICFGLFAPLAFVGLAPRSGADVLVATWMVALTVVALACAWFWRGLQRATGAMVIAGYGALVATIVVTATS
jgi:cation:H+ antiporter